MVMRRVSFVLGLAALLPVLSSGTASAQAQYTMAQRCVIANEDCFVMRAAADGLAPEKRLDQVNDRLAYILGYESLRPSNIRLVQNGGEFDIVVGNSKLVSVTAADARANGTRNVRGLAQVWLRNLRRAMPQARPLSAVAALPTSTQIARK
jgi:hypothetical protein